MSDVKGVQDIDLRGIRNFKKSLVCSKCTRFPRPGVKVYACSNCNAIACATCIAAEWILKCRVCFGHRGFFGEKTFTMDPKITKFISFFKFHPCINIQNGCNDEFDAKVLEDHEKYCLFRNVTCPDKNCSASIVFNNILDHYKTAHPKVESKDEVLRFKGTIEQLETSISF